MTFHTTTALAAAVPEGRLFGLDQQTLVQFGINLFNVILLAIILAKLLYNPFRNMLHKRTERIRGQIEHAAGEMAKANEIKLEYEQKCEEIEREQEVILENARRIATETGRMIITEAKREADAIKARATANIELERERAREEMRLAIIDISKAMAEMYLRRAIDDGDHDRFFAEAMTELEDASWRN